MKNPKHKRSLREPRQRKTEKQVEEDPTDVRLVLSPQHKVVAPYQPESEGENFHLRFLIHFCEFPVSWGNSFS
jgi:hypothetical protein